MNYKLQITTPCVLLLLALATCTSPKEEITNTLDTEHHQQAAEDNALAENIFDDIFKQINQAVETTEEALFTRKKEAKQDDFTCMGLSYDEPTGADDHFSLNVSVNYGKERCLGPDGTYRRGKMQLKTNGRFRDPGTTVTVTFHDFQINDYQVLATITIINNGYNERNHLSHTLEVQNASIEKNGLVFNWSALRNREWIAGSDTPIADDDVFAITGTAAGTTSAGYNYTIEIQEPLIVKAGCKWITAGTFTVRSNQNSAYSVNYGDSAVCDPNAIASDGQSLYPLIFQ